MKEQLSARPTRVLMLLENSCFPEDSRVLLQAQALTAAGYRVTVICPTEPGFRKLRETIDGIDVYRYPAPPQWGGLWGYGIEYGYSLWMQTLLSVWVLLRRGFDTIHMHTPPDLNAILPAAYRLLGKRFIYDVHDLSPELYLAQRAGRQKRLVYRILLACERFASRTCTLALATNESQRDIQAARCGVSPQKYWIVRNGPNQCFLDYPCEQNRTSDESSPITLGYVGVMGAQDGVEKLIEALDHLINKRGFRNLRAVLVGDGDDRPRLLQLVQQWNLQSYVTFTGRVPFAEVPHYVARFDICCTPDPSNPYNDSCTTVKTMEYMALEKPVVCFETLENMKTASDAALYAKNNDAYDFANQIAMLINDPELRITLGRLGRQRTLKSLAWSFQAERLVAAYANSHPEPRPRF